MVDKELDGLTIFIVGLKEMERELTAMLAICRGRGTTTPCSLCGEDAPSEEIQEHNGYCEYCSMQDERAEQYRERKSPDEP